MVQNDKNQRQAIKYCGRAKYLISEETEQVDLNQNQLGCEKYNFLGINTLSKDCMLQNLRVMN